jgi:hypothetical protein
VRLHVFKNGALIRKPPLEEKMFYFQDVLRLPAGKTPDTCLNVGRCFGTSANCFNLKHPIDVWYGRCFKTPDVL